ncbi:glutaminyl-tRNA synthase, glutamine-hydrolyzing, subunit A (glutamyl-tRNA(Gln) amidotransferase, subunit A) [Flavobacteriales bacterium ALC-1]|nr:glutaminyl-tRNA synthase, glutamine-hydrolyzing, subunit A (glutamyl-tRNA(Gln) amidotransferase, subunit A) [Flavobacteriales bacterium ALC-1]
MRNILFLLAFLFVLSCKNSKPTDTKIPAKNSETTQDSSGLSAISTKDFREFKVLDSKNLTQEEIWEAINPQLKDFTEEDYNRLKQFILEKDITDLQINRTRNKFTYEELTKFYLYRIRKFDRENPLSLNSVIAVNPNVIEEAKLRDRDFRNKRRKHPIFGMPILLKDNVNASNMATTAGAVVLKDNFTEDAFIVNKLKSNEALILGKANLSEWAYFFCGDCPSGYSAVGGQTLNPYGRRIIDTGGSSSGSGVSVAANFCAAAIGSETSGSILSPASQNSTVGLKPTIGLVSRSGIVPISSTLDTAGPITKTVRDNAIVLDAIYGYDKSDLKSLDTKKSQAYYEKPSLEALKGKRFGAPKRLLKDTLYINALKVIKSQGAEIVEIDEEQLGLPNFLSLLNLDMKTDLPIYMESYANKNIGLRTVSDIMAFNLKDSIKTMPYGQNLFKGIVNDKGDAEYLERIKDTLSINGKQYFDNPMKTHNLDGFLSINNYHAGFAAVAEYPALTVPMGYTGEGVPKGLTFIGKRLQEKQLLEWAYVYEQASKARIAPRAYN